MIPSPKKILVVSLDNLGDAVMASSVFPVLRSFFPQAELGFWVKRYCVDAFVDFPMIDHLHSADPFWDKSPGQGKGGIGTFLWALREVRQLNYDTVLVLNAEWRRAAACFFARIPQRIGFDRRKSRPFLNQVFRSPSVETHVVDEHRALLEFWLKTNISPALCQPSLSVSPELYRWVKDWRSEAGLSGRPLVFLHPFTGDPLKTWPLQSFEHVIESLQKQNPDHGFVISCGPGDVPAFERTFGAKKNLNVAKLVNRPLREIKAVISQSRLYIAADTGPSHLAAAVGTPVIALFGPTSPARYRPRGNGTVKIFQHSPITDIHPAEVTKAAVEILGRP